MAEVTARYVGLDVHKHTIAVAIAETSGPPELYGVIPNDPKVVRGLVEKLGQGRRLLVRSLQSVARTLRGGPALRPSLGSRPQGPEV